MFAAVPLWQGRAVAAPMGAASRSQACFREMFADRNKDAHRWMGVVVAYPMRLRGEKE
jgi:hypothetical protein